jgi:hypothetical protein
VLLTLAAAGLVGHRLGRRGPGHDRGRRDDHPDDHPDNNPDGDGRASSPRPHFVPQPDDVMDVVALPPLTVPATLRLRPHPDRSEHDVDVEVMA